MYPLPKLDLGFSLWVLLKFHFLFCFLFSHSFFQLNWSFKLEDVINERSKVELKCGDYIGDRDLWTKKKFRKNVSHHSTVSEQNNY